MSGGRLRAFNLMRELAARGWSVSLFSVAHEGMPAPGVLARLEDLLDEVVIAPLGRSTRARSARLALDSLVRQPFERRYFHSRSAEAELARLAGRDYDAIVMGQLYTEPYARAFPPERTVLDSYNVEARRVATMTAAGGARALAARLQAKPVAAYEADVVRRVGRTWAVSEEERTHFDALAPARVDLVPNGVDCRGLPPRETIPSEPRVLFLGRMDYGANVDAVRFLIDSVLPAVGSAAHVEVVGANPPGWLATRAGGAAKRVDVVGYVEETRPYLDRARLMVVPLRVGGGTRLKILEALARGLPVVTTTLGCEGLGLVDGRDALIADEPEALAAAIDRLLEDDSLCASLAQAGRRTVEERFDWRSIAAEAERSLERLAAQAVATPRDGTARRPSAAGS